MNGYLDHYIRQGLKNWTAQHSPPDNVKARLLLTASEKRIIHQVNTHERDERYNNLHRVYRWSPSDFPSELISLNRLWILAMAPISFQNVF